MKIVSVHQRDLGDIYFMSKEGSPRSIRITEEVFEEYQKMMEKFWSFQALIENAEKEKQEAARLEKKKRMKIIRITAADVGKTVRLRNGAVSLITNFNPEQTHDRVTTGETTMRDCGHVYGEDTESYQDIVEVLGFPGEGDEQA